MDPTFLLYEVNEAFKQCASTLALSRSPLAALPLVTPTLVLDNVAPTADERGHGLRIVLQWAVEQLAPTPPRYPFGEFRPWDDPTWREPAWWRYNILRHRYLEPLSPDDFVEGGRVTETLLSLTGIPSVDTFFDERNRAIRSVTGRLARQLADSAADGELQHLALAVAMRPLAGRSAALALLTIAAALDGVFGRAMLLDLATDEGLLRAEAPLEELTRRRFLLAGDEGANLWLSPPLRAYVYRQAPPQTMIARHARAAGYLQAHGETMAAARQWSRAGRYVQAASILLVYPGEMADSMTAASLRELLQEIPAGQLPPDTWQATRIRLADLCAAAGATDDAIAACRAALKVTTESAVQARIYRRLGKLYEQRNQMHALNYYRQAEERFAPSDPELPTLLKDRGWLHILRKEWPAAAEALARALALAPASATQTRADILDALASLHRHQDEFGPAVDYAQKALALREEAGDPLRVAKSLGNLGLLYSSTGDYAHAAAAHREAMELYRRLGNRELMATAWLNLGMSHHLAGERTTALAAYRACLSLCQEVNLPLAEVRVLYNLAEVQMELDDPDSARRCWQQGLDLAHVYGFSDQVGYFESLAVDYPGIGGQASTTSLLPPATQAGLVLAAPETVLSPHLLDPDVRHALDLAQQHGQVTPRMLMAAASISKATATRRLAEMVAGGLLHKHGTGRSTCYTAAVTSAGAPGADRTHAITTRLQQLHAIFAERFGVAEFDPLDPPPAPASVHLRVRFARQPDLQTFFALEQQIGALLGVTVDLVPAESSTKLNRFDTAPGM